MNKLPLLVLLVFGTIFCAGASAPMGEEEFGNKPLNAANYVTWPGLVSVFNDDNRVYRQWVNGSEFCCYRGDTDALNALLANYAEVTADKLEVVLRPGAGVAQTFEKDKSVEYDWKVHVNGGIAAHMATRDQGDKIWHTWPVVTIQVTDRIDLDRLVIPDNVDVLQIHELKTRYLPCLESTDQNVRGWCCGHLAELNQYDTETMELIAEKLSDESSWVRLNAVIALATFGDKADKMWVAGQIEANLDTEDAQLKERAEKVLKAIRAATPDPDAEQAHDRTLDTIREYCQKR
ncbi:MAG: HEAT repeat domain-containing protein [Pirellulaceae bacterium]